MVLGGMVPAGSSAIGYARHSTFVERSTWHLRFGAKVHGDADASLMGILGVSGSQGWVDITPFYWVSGSSDAKSQIG